MFGSDSLRGAEFTKTTTHKLVRMKDQTMIYQSLKQRFNKHKLTRFIVRLSPKLTVL